MCIYMFYRIQTLEAERSRLQNTNIEAQNMLEAKQTAFHEVNNQLIELREVYNTAGAEHGAYKEKAQKILQVSIRNNNRCNLN